MTQTTHSHFTHPIKQLQLCLVFFLALLGGSVHAAGGGGGTAPAPGQPVYHKLEPAIVVNVLDKGKMRFLQVAIDLMAMDGQAIAAVQQHMAPIRHELLMLFAHRNLDDVIGLQARETLRKEALTRVQNVLLKYAEIDSAAKLKTEDGKEYPAGVQELLFTSFIVQ